MRTGIVVIRKAGEAVMPFTEARVAFKAMASNPPENAVAIELWSSDGGLLQKRSLNKPVAAVHPIVEQTKTRKSKSV